jgi:hypothetical protein
MSWLLHYDEKKRNTIYPKNYCKRGIHCNVQCLNCTLKVWISCQVLPTICCSILYHAVFRSFQQLKRFFFYFIRISYWCQIWGWTVANIWYTGFTPHLPHTYPQLPPAALQLQYICFLRRVWRYQRGNQNQ